MTVSQRLIPWIEILSELHSGLVHCPNKLRTIKSSPACIIRFHISNARPSLLRNMKACSRLTEQPCSLASRNR